MLPSKWEGVNVQIFFFFLPRKHAFTLILRACEGGIQKVQEARQKEFIFALPFLATSGTLCFFCSISYRFIVLPMRTEHCASLL